MKTKQFDFNSPRVGYNPEAKRAFHRNGRRQIQALAYALGLRPGSYDIRSNQGGIAVSGEVTLHADNLYVQLSQSCLTTLPGILFRSCQGRKDYTGGPNKFANANLLNEPEALAKVITKAFDPHNVAAALIQANREYRFHGGPSPLRG